MIELEVTVENESGIAGVLSGLRSQIPYATATALNMTADGAQKAIRESLPEHFTLRRKTFIERTIYRSRDDFARKDRLVATVRVNPERDFLAKFEHDTTKRARDKGSLAVPIIREKNPGMIIGRGSPLSLQRIMALINQQGGRAMGPHTRGRAKRAASEAFYIVHSKAGNTVILQRTASTTRVVYAFKRQVPIEPDLHFEDIAYKTAINNWSTYTEQAIERAIATMR